MKQYYIVNLKHTSKGDTALLFWCADGAGYTHHRDRAGIYNEDVVDRYTSSDNPKVEKELVDPFWMNALDYNDYLVCVPNNPTVLHTLNISDKEMKPKKWATFKPTFLNTPINTQS